MTSGHPEDAASPWPGDSGRPTDPAGDLLGRTHELAVCAGLLGRSDVSLVTVTGMGGIGKTRLAMRLAHDLRAHFPDGTRLVELASVTSAELVPQAVATVLGLGGEQAAPEAVFAALRGRRMLLVLDNLEHVMDAASFVAELLVEAPGVRVLTTSRAPLQLTGEYEVPLGPLALPEAADRASQEALLAVPAVALFVARASKVQPQQRWDLPALDIVADIVIRLGGWPLSLELAAARLRLFALPALRSALDAPLRVLTRGARDRPPRQQTLRATLDWSHALLGQEERALLARLGVFPGTFTPAEVEGALGELGRLDVLAALVEHSWVVRLGAESGAFTLLEPVREYALEQLSAQEAVDAARGAHAQFYLRQLEALSASGEATREYFAWVDRRYPHLRSAMNWALSAGALDLALRLERGLLPFWSMSGSGLVAEGRVWAESLLAQVPASDERAVAHLCTTAGLFAGRQGEFAAARQQFERALALARRLNDPVAEADSLLKIADAARMGAGTPAEAEAMMRGVVQRFLELGDMGRWLHATTQLAVHLDSLGRYSEALLLLEDIRDEARRYPDPRVAVRLLIYSAWLLIRLGRAGEARAPLDEAQARLHGLPLPSLQQAVQHALGEWAMATGRDAEAEAYLARAQAIMLELRAPYLLAGLLETQARLAERRGETARAADLYRQMLAQVGPGGAHYLLEDARKGLARSEGKLEEEAAAPPRPRVAARSGPGLTDLTLRETEVLALLARGNTNAGIAAALGISLPSVNAHLRTIFSKLGVGSRVLAARLAVERGLVDPAKSPRP
ncbi:ATP-binding protein [Deinococcus irradiatisoli]|nr:LuxR C-terminal-related transcriptional regulator [Deinococcus irradiatisoli]